MQATPTTWRLLRRAGWQPPEGFAAWCGGEAFPADLAADLAGSGAAVWNMYGPTETTVWSSVHRVTGGEDPVPLGRPVANTRLLVVDDALAPVPVGVPGELLIGGSGVAVGYRDRPELTAERFVTHPELGAAYRTGDVVRWRADGTLEYLGRGDQQVKVRGYRIEMGEIESVLRDCAGIRDAAVALRQVGDDPRLVAYVVPDGHDAPAEDALRAACRARLPEYMVPGTVMVLDALPLNPNGKIDRNALPAPDVRRGGEGYLAPRDETEERVAAIMAEVLGIDRVGVHDDFFALGGHSLLATSLTGRIAAALGTELPVRAVFTDPTVAGLAAVLSAGTEAVAAPAVPAVPRRPDERGLVRFPASFQQRRVWFLTQFDPGSAAAYVLHGALRLRGALDRAALRRAVDVVVARHESLRTGLVEVDGDPVQVIHPTVDSPLSEVDVSGSGDPEAAAAETVAEAARRGFELTEASLLRVTLAVIGSDDAVLGVALHHAIADRIAVEAFTRELSTAYIALAGGEQPALPELPVQYADYAMAQRDFEGSDAERDQLAYWRAQLADLAVLDLPTDRPRPSTQTYRGATRTVRIPAELVDRLTARAEERGATRFMVLLAGYALMLSRYARTADVAVGSPISGRYRPEVEPLIGYFTNNLVLRTDLSGDPTVAEVLDQVRATCLDAFGHADVPFEKLVEHLHPERDLAHSPLFSAMFITTELPAPSLRLGAVTATPVPPSGTSAKYDLTFTAFPAAKGTSAQQVIAEYNTDLFDADTVDRMLEHYRLVLDALAGPADRPLSELPVLPDNERARLTAWGSGDRRTVPELSLTGLLDERFDTYAERVCVSDSDGELTYAEVDRRANQLAHHLRSLGVSRGDRVALFTERNRMLPVALFGVLRAGAAYVPIDVDFPPDRVALLLSDSGSVAVLTVDDLVDRLPDPLPGPLAVDGRVIRLDSDWDRVAAAPGTPLPDGPGPDDLAYIIYTSGSTGRPKGVLLPHRPVVNFLQTMAYRPGMQPTDVVGAANTISCDMPVLDLYLPLLVGARIEMIPSTVVTDSERLAERLTAAGVTYLQGTPTTWRLLQEAGWRPDGPFTALAGAEKVPADLAHWIRGLGVEVWHLYGPTETAVWSTVHRVEEGDDPLPLGGPVANTRLLVVDEHDRRVPIGVPGELLIGGAGVAAGYWQRPELTEERFVPDPELPAQRVYRTGDVVRWRADGLLEFLGRVDFQVKVRGYRIELGEIESVLRAHSAVRDSVVALREDTPGDRRLVGYVDLVDAAGTDRAALVRQLHAQCRDRLPEYMVPSALVVLDALPLTANRNKVDRAKLPAPDGARPDLGDYLAPRTPVEKRLAAIYAEVLSMDRVGVHDDFFSLGGHSLLATRVVARVRAEFGVDVPVRTMFTHPTVARLAGTLPVEPAPERPAEQPPIPVLYRMPQVGGELSGRFVLPASSGQRRLWFLDQLDPASAGAYTVDSAVRLTGPFDPAALQAAVDVVVARHETLRTSFVEVDGEPVQVVAPSATVPVDHVDLTGADPAQLTEHLAGLSGRPFDLATGPLCRMTLVRVGAEEHVLHLALHHAICDRWSVQILARDLVTAYGAESASPGTAALPAPAVQYGDHAAAQQQWLASPAVGTQIEYWRQRLAGLPVTELPTDRPRPDVRRYAGDIRWDRIPADLVEKLTARGREHGATLFMVTLAACHLLMSRYSRQEDVAVGSPVSGRHRPELEELVGFFVNNLVLRAELGDDPTVGGLLDQVRDSCLEAYANADVPFERLVEELRPDRERARTPLFSVLFAVQNTPPAGQKMGPAAVTPVDLRPGTAQFDLSIMLVPDADTGDLRLRVEYDSELFDPDTVDRIIAQYRLLLSEVVGDPARRVSQLDALTSRERSLLLDEWVRTSPQDTEGTLALAFAAQAERTPDAVAAACGDESLTYAQLAARAAEVACRLAQQGVDPGSRVGLLAEQGLGLLTGILGVLYAGAAYVPLDVSWPADRMAFVLSDAGVKVLLAEPDRGAGLDFAGATVTLDGATGGSAGAGPVACQPDDVAYIIYTSGSTGRPKGVMVSSRNVLRLVKGARTHLTFSPDDVFSLFHSAAFDVSVFEMWGAWLSGAQLAVVPYLAARDPREVHRRLAAHRVSVLSQTPTAFRQLAAVDAEGAERLDALRYIVFAGEPLDVRTLRGWLDRYGDAQPELINMYGTTETTVHATYHRVRAAELDPPVRNLVGRPLPDLRFHLLDSRLRPVPVGAVGEICIGGPGVAHGYAGRPELTAERFVTDPFTADSRLYRTGDVARWLPDGTLEFLGRGDDQVKIRGFRVEPGEVEAVLREHPDVADAVVVARAGRATDTELAGYVVPRDGTRPSPADLRAHARRLLPEYLTPATVTVLDVLPRTSSGKVDKRALPAPERSGGGAEHVEPRDDLERRIAEVWRDVLGVPRVGVYDDFFDLGGHSLLATRAMSRIRAAIGSDAGVRALFDHPTVAGLATDLRGGTDAAADPADTVPALPRGAGVCELPASSGQRRLWLLGQLDAASSGTYLVGSVVRLTGALDLDGLRAAFAAVVRRHEPLRTSLGESDGEVVQLVHPDLDVPVDVVDLSDADDPTAAAETLVRERLTTPFDLTAAPLARICVARLSDTEHLLMLAMHHGIGDQGSTQVIVRDLAEGYRAWVAGEPAELPALDVQYGDVAAWQRDRTAAGGYDTGLSYWTGQLAALPVLDLPTDLPRPPAQSYRGAQRTTEVPADLVARLSATARRYDATPFMAALTAYQVLLGRYAAQQDFGVAVPVAGRDRPELDGLVGFLAGTLVLRADLTGAPTVADLLGRARRTCLDAYGHADVPFESVVERLGVARDLSRTPLAQAGFALVERVAGEDRELAGIRVEPLAFDPGTAKTDLTVTLVPTDAGGWQLIGEYSTDLFRADTVDRLLAHLTMLFEEFAADADRPLAALPALPVEEQQLVDRWSYGPVRELPALTWPDLFDAQVAAGPDRLAVRHDGRDVTYRELDTRATRLAHRLCDLGVAANTLVAIVAERSVEMIVAVLAVHKAGGAYVPVDPSYPPERVSFMLTDSAAAVLLTQQHLVDTLPESGTPVLVLDDGTDDGTDGAGPVEALPRRCGPDDLAYVIYTSGSTGTPKGVCVEHRSVVNLDLTRYHAALHENSRVLQFAPFSFDVSVFEQVLSLLGGVPLVVPTPQEMAGGAQLVELINREQVTFTFIPPSLLAHLSPEHVPTLEVLGSGGEDCPAEVAERWGGQKKFLIGYGPTETTVYSTVTDEIVGGGHPPIGRPVVNTVARVLDADLRPRPLGTPGELYLGGAGLARGYLNRPDQTAAAFVTHPRTGERLYRTGDSVRYLPDGTLEFLGRLDDQVKLRGFRIELGEVASALRTADRVLESVAVVREDTPGDKRLVGYLVAEPGSDPAEVRRSARAAAEERLPRYMVPAALMVLPRLPLGPNGKVDRRALPVPPVAEGADGYLAPSTPTEKRLTRMVADALRIERVGLDDDFFAIGGHSLLAARLHAAIRRVWGVDLPVRALFENSRIGDLATLLDQQGDVDPAAVEAEHADTLRADITLPDDIRPAGRSRFRAKPRGVLVTGATGFLGAFLVERLADAGATVRCLVRGRDTADAQRRLEEQLRGHGLWRDEWSGRVVALLGDLSSPRLGLSEPDFAALARDTDEIYHSGAVVHFQQPYPMLRDGNVGGTLEILRLATLDRPIPLHYVSTLSVFGGLATRTDLDPVLREGDLPDVPPPANDTGYNHSKWVAEHVVALAREAGVPVAVHRPGRIGGDQRSGLWRSEDLVCRVIRACAVTGLVPDAGLATDLVPVDHLAAAITGLARHRESLGATFHFSLAEKVPLVALADVLASRGYDVRRASVADWYTAVVAAAEAGDDQVGPVLTMYAGLAEGRAGGPGEPVIDTTNTRTVLGDELPPPAVDDETLGRYVDALRDNGMLPPPARAKTAQRSDDAS
ncbi:MAG: amino acid adenylation domain-containing protein [Actinocatenispora sp.]